MGANDKNGMKTGYSCPNIVHISMSVSAKAYVCVTEQIYVDNWGETIYYQGPINDTTLLGHIIPF